MYTHVTKGVFDKYKNLYDNMFTIEEKYVRKPDICI